MDKLGFPKKNQSQSIGRSGEAYFDYFVTSKLGWIFRPVHRESDFGIDGFIDLVKDGEVNGKSIAVQIKCGESYLNEKTADGLKYIGENKHINFYLNSKLPIILIIIKADCSIGYWTQFDINLTMQIGNGWWQEIQINNILDERVKTIWEAIAGDVKDYSDEVAQLWNIDSLLDEAGPRTFAIPKEEVENESMDYIVNIIKRHSKTREQALKNRGRLEVFFPEYDEDSREIFEIPEIRSWFRKSVETGVPWFYFIDTNIGSCLKLLMFCFCRIIKNEKQSNGYMLTVDPEDFIEFIQRNIDNNNLFTEAYEITEEINKERCKAVFMVFGQELE